MVDRVLHRFQAHARAQGRIRRSRTVARGQHRFVRRSAIFVGQNAVVFVQSAHPGQIRRRQHANAHYHGVRRQRSIAGFDSLDPLSAGEAPNLFANANANPRIAVQAGKPIGNASADHAAHHPLLRLQNCDFGARRRRGCRHFQSDIASAHNHDSPPRSQFAAQMIGIGQRPQIVDAGQIRARNIQLAQGASGGQRQPVVAKPLAAVQQRALAGPVNRNHPSAQAQFHVPVPVVRRPAKQQPLALQLSGQELLGKRGALIGELILVADQGDPAFVAAKPERDGELRGGLSAAHDQHRFAGGAH